MLQKHGIKPAKVQNVMRMKRARELNIHPNSGMKYICGALLGVGINKSLQMSFTPAIREMLAQGEHARARAHDVIRYAATDAKATVQVGLYLSDMARAQE